MSNNTPPSFTIMNDTSEPAKDLLHFTRYVEPLVHVIDQASPPFTIGIFGRWGTGKTTLMKQLDREVGLRGHYRLEFNPWLYQSEPNLLVPLLHTFADTLLKESKESGERLRETAGRIATITGRVALNVFLSTITGGAVTAEDVRSEIDEYGTAHARAISAIRTLRSDLQAAVDTITDQGRRRLVIFIDDLDRCVPTKIMSLLEAIKLFLDLDHMIVVLAIDHEIVQQGIRGYYKDHIDPKECTRLTIDYIDKMIQMPLYLHPLGPSQVRNFIEQACAAPQVHDQIDLFERCLKPNPRQIKRTLNIYLLTSAIIECDPRLQALDKGLLAKLIVIQQQWNELYRDVLRMPTLLVILDWIYRGQLRPDPPWPFLDSRREELRTLYKSYYQPFSTLEHIFTGAPSFAQTALPSAIFDKPQEVEPRMFNESDQVLQEYLFLLG